jgi:hypothetical protein
LVLKHRFDDVQEKCRLQNVLSIRWEEDCEHGGVDVRDDEDNIDSSFESLTFSSYVVHD